jgi:hypothetical protein
MGYLGTYGRKPDSNELLKAIYEKTEQQMRERSTLFNTLIYDWKLLPKTPAYCTWILTFSYILLKVLSKVINQASMMPLHAGNMYENPSHLLVTYHLESIKHDSCDIHSVILTGALAGTYVLTCEGPGWSPAWYE